MVAVVVHVHDPADLGTDLEPPPHPTEGDQALADRVVPDPNLARHRVGGQGVQDVVAAGEAQGQLDRILVQVADLEVGAEPLVPEAQTATIWLSGPKP